MSALRKVLVVDDDPVVGKSFDRVLGHDGYVVVTAGNAVEALAKLEDGEYDLVYTDIRMPGMDGLELAERVKARRAWTPVVIITGYGTEANEQRAKDAGVSAFLHKPLSPEVIEANAKAMLRAAIAAPVAAAAVPAGSAVEAEVVREGAPAAAASAARSPWGYAAVALAAPFIGLAWIIALPVLGLAALAWFAAEAFVRRGGVRSTGRFLRNAGLFLAAPFIGLAYVVAMPVVGLGALAWTALRGSRRNGHPG